MAGLVANPNDVLYTMDQVAEHNTEGDCWTVLNGRVYDITKYASSHPGGDEIFRGMGIDCTQLYN